MDVIPEGSTAACSGSAEVEAPSGVPLGAFEEAAWLLGIG